MRRSRAMAFKILGDRCGLGKCGLCKISCSRHKLLDAGYSSGLVEFQQPMPAADANRSIQHSRLRHAGMPSMMPACDFASRSPWAAFQSIPSV